MKHFGGGSRRVVAVDCRHKYRQHLYHRTCWRIAGVDAVVAATSMSVLGIDIAVRGGEAVWASPAVAM